jgi:HAD superfamily hydrolase (TIGR01450 family)
MSVARDAVRSPVVRLAGCPVPLARAYDLAVLDLDGVVYVGPDAVPGAAQALARARAAGMGVAFVTNNASRPPQAVVDHLVRLGVEAHLDDVVTSAQVAARLLAGRLPAGSAVLVVGGDGLRLALTEEGLRPVGSMDDSPVAVVQGFGPDVGWRQLAEGARAVRSGLPWVATNLDLTVPTAHGPAPGNGTLVGAVATAAGRPPDEVAGKPAPGSFLEAARRHGSRRPLVVGDRLDTDLEGAVNAAMDGLVVLTGVSTATDLMTCGPAVRPTHVGRDLGALDAPVPAAALQVDGGSGTALCRAARVRVEASGIVVETAGGDAVDLLRAGCTAAWTWADERVERSGAVAAGPQRGADVPGVAGVVEALRGLEPDAPWAR